MPSSGLGEGAGVSGGLTVVERWAADWGVSTMLGSGLGSAFDDAGDGVLCLERCDALRLAERDPLWRLASGIRRLPWNVYTRACSAQVLVS